MGNNTLNGNERATFFMVCGMLFGVVQTKEPKIMPKKVLLSGMGHQIYFHCAYIYVVLQEIEEIGLQRLKSKKVNDFAIELNRIFWSVRSRKNVTTSRKISEDL